MLVFGIAGAFAMLVLFTVLKSLLGTVGIFGARGAIGLAAQMAAGSCAGVLFVRLTPTGNRGGAAGGHSSLVRKPQDSEI
jgi:hypothetical protein